MNHTVDGWLKYFQKKNADYFHTQKRGRKRILSEAERAEVQDAITKLSASIVCSWDATAIPRALWADVPSIEPLFDVLKKLHLEETQHPCECGSLTARTCLSCSEYVCDGCWLDHTATVCPAL